MLFFLIVQAVALVENQEIVDEAPGDMVVGYAESLRVGRVVVATGFNTELPFVKAHACVDGSLV